MTAEPFISVIIPTYNRKDSLLRTLDSLSRQTLAAEHFELIVVDDGSDDGTEDALMACTYPFRMRYFLQPHLGPGSARQLGSTEASSNLLLFLDDDMVCEPAVVAEHVWAHAQYPRSVMKGQVILHLDNPTTVFAARQNGTPDQPLNEREIRPLGMQDVFAGHMSIGRAEMAEVGGWSTERRGYGFEDLDFMYRCEQIGLGIYYVPGAVTYHHDYAVTLEKYGGRSERAAKTAAATLFRHYPELRDRIPMFRDKGPIEWRSDPPALVLRKLARQVVSSRLSMRFMERSVPSLESRWPESRLLMLFYRWIISGYIYRGYRDGLRD